MTGLPERPPRGLRWIDNYWARFGAFVLVLLSVGLSIYVANRYLHLVDCLNANDTADRRRTAAIATATDAERAAQRRLIVATTREESLAARAATIASYDATDRVRAQNPPSMRSCE